MVDGLASVVFFIIYLFKFNVKAGMHLPISRWGRGEARQRRGI